MPASGGPKFEACVVWQKASCPPTHPPDGGQRWQTGEPKVKRVPGRPCFPRGTQSEKIAAHVLQLDAALDDGRAAEEAEGRPSPFWTLESGCTQKDAKSSSNKRGAVDTRWVDSMDRLTILSAQKGECSVGACCVFSSLDNVCTLPPLVVRFSFDVRGRISGECVTVLPLPN
ncbi:hypothetical protein MUK42_15795 [Musa troglodytarum]|uniref:Uncharacterized protein n=1 Tax=Musa troglodytarum TaxID=320322 RepID=A0A9E7HFW4_9LILI|nr:hypothetical protein MUK42_15795 [Musa troglodytarum]